VSGILGKRVWQWAGFGKRDLVVSREGSEEREERLHEQRVAQARAAYEEEMGAGILPGSAVDEQPRSFEEDTGMGMEL
jgi:hypothetical protein